ncbi:GDSL-type esterase/lipase family protein [Runella limosa]|uniref:GDSL-type esterase/lipase family protein n=1 Tax=Runella limosa TaxID=370978 RepID=UPI0004059883|nr:GDSL-type esterase/lipase family protein [Runella limosa]
MKKAFLIVAALLLGASLESQAQQVIPLYEGKAPGSENWTWTEKEYANNGSKNRVIYNVVQPTLTVYLPKPEMATGTAIIVAPGGAFHILSIDNEGIEVAKWLNSKGIAAFVLKYRLVRSMTDNPVAELMPKMQDFKKLDEINAPVVEMAVADGKKAIEYVRSHAKELDILPNQIGIMGFSAGGALTLGVALSYTAANRPDFIAPIYPKTDIFGPLKVPADAPPAWVCAASDDQLGFAPHATALYDAWIGAKKIAELHMYQKGGHGFGMNKQKIPTDTWYERFGEWMKLQGLLKKLRPSALELKYSEEQIANFERNDWANFSRYSEANKKLPAPKDGENRVVFLGNSITQGWVNKQPDFFAKGNYIGRGISGQTSPQALLRFRPDVVDLKPKVVVINIGINDIAENTGPYNPDFTLGNIASMVEIAKANGIKVVLASVHPAYEFPWRKDISDVPNKIIRFNERLKQYAQSQGVVYLDYHSAMKDSRNGMAPDIAEDGVHPTLKGYQIMAPLAEAAIATALKGK